ncbi:AMP-binding protein [Roseococcus sp. DSY-14]|uniref:AMP-binding protein n=1 Tax=Roseococcus sp. DSY-14 TaxID=3369650 RepID=UPI00387B9B97
MRDGMTFAALLEQRLATAPDAVAFIADGEQVTVAGFDALCRRATACLQAQGVGRGDLVAVWLVNRIEWLALLFALARLGAALVTVNTRYRSEEVAHILRRSGARLLVTQAGFRRVDFLAILAGIAPGEIPALERIALLDGDAAAPAQVLGRPVTRLDLRAHAPAPGEDASDPGAPAILFPTSGTTKGPKLVIHPQRTVVGHARNCAAAHGLDQPGAVLLAGLPLCGVFGLNSVLAAFAGGAPVVLMEAFEGPAAAALFARHGVTHMYGSDEMFRRMMDAAPGDQPFPTARVFGFGAFTTSFADDARDAWSRGMPFLGMYGSSEVLALFALQPRELPVEERVRGGGRPVAGAAVQLRIRDGATGALAPAGASGEIEIRAPSTFLGYLNDPEATAAALLPDGFFRTGDVGHLRPDGTLVYEARMGDAMRLGGFLVSPAEIEDVLKRLPGVADAQVVAAEIGGQPRAVAFVIPAPGAAPEAAALIARSAEGMGAFKVPARLWFVAEYPMTDGTNGLKVQRNRLRDMARERLALEERA